MVTAIRESGFAEVAASLESGSTLPASWFTDPEIFRLEQERIFGRSWQLVGLVSQLERPGDFFTYLVGRVPIVVVRAEDGGINALVNVCRHRGAAVVTEPSGHRMTLQCPYHAWTYGLDGCLRKAPRSERNADFDPDGIALPSFRAEALGPLVFVSPDADARPVAEVIGPWLDHLRGYGIELDPTLRVVSTSRYTVEANWKVICQNGLECYHCPTCHPGLAAAKDVTQDWLVDLFDDFASYRFPAADDPSARGRSPAGQSQLNHLWPNAFPTVRDGGFVTSLQVFPVAPGRSIYQRQYWFGDGVSEQTRTEYMEFLDATDREDFEICASVQRGLESGFYDHGRLMLPNTEPLIRFHERRVLRALTE